jgi:hypothetical protein
LHNRAKSQYFLAETKLSIPFNQSSFHLTKGMSIKLTSSAVPAAPITIIILRDSLLSGLAKNTFTLTAETTFP